MCFVRWIFYDPDTGNVKYSAMQQGDFVPVPPEEAAKAFGVEGAAYMMWAEPDAEIEAAFKDIDGEGAPRLVHVAVDISREPHAPVFEYGPVPVLQDEREDMVAALTLLGAVPQEGD